MMSNRCYHADLPIEPATGHRREVLERMTALA
jgi:hypothetical protein